jgi:uncharacterized protein YjbI with pentapeptide repeats/3',5'-cyclic AMP phosphodiesterase CpdA/WD40 repeat protein
VTRPPGPHRRTLTLLHLSDPQFGRHHREATGGTASDRDHDTLRARLLQDLASLEDEGEPVRPELVVVTGDLSEQARPSELREFETFAAGLLEGLGLPRDRLVLVPGNHDVSWAACEAYFKQCEAEERAPVPPYWPKWHAYAELFQRWYGGIEAPFELTEARPYTLYVYESLRTVVAALNSTMPETHRDGEHHGALGEDQLRWFQEQLRPFRARGFLRIAAVHHNVQRKAQHDDENLRDAELLDRLLGDEVNLVLHGHTHDGKLGWLRPQVPLLSTGSAAVEGVARPHGVPCQYQLLRVHAGGVRRLTRAHQEAQRRWVGDTAASVDGNEWRHDHAVTLVDVHGAFPPDSEPDDEPDDEGEELPRLDPRRRAGDARGADGFLAHLAEIACLREPRAEVVRRRKGPPPIEWIELRRQQGEQVELVPIGGHERGVDEAMVEAFVQRVVPAYRLRDPGVRPQLVYGGPPAAAELVERARAAGVWLRSYEQYCGLIDFRGYRERLRARLSADRVYPPDKYVGQRMLERIGREEQRHEDALGTVRHWLDDEHGRFVLVLGTFGTGKTFLLRELARRLAGEEGAVVPILVEMRSLEKGLRLEQLLAQHFALHDVEDYSPARFMRMLEDGRVVLLFDGFDELVVRSTYARAAEHFETIVSAARGRAKVVVTSRRQHFLSDHQAKEAVRQVLLQKVEAVPGHRVVTLLPFEDDQIEAFLAAHLGDVAAAHARMRLIAEVRDLAGLSSNPRMLGFIAALGEAELRAARDRQGAVSAAGLYRTLLERWLAFEQDRRHPPGAPPGLDLEARWAAVTELALRLWTRSEHHVGVDELEAIGAVLVELAAGTKEEAGFQIGSGTLLVRDEDGRFSFIHESVMEWLVAHAGAKALASEEAPEILGRGKLSQLLADFLIDLAGNEAVSRWSARALAANLGNATADNALLVRRRLVATGLMIESTAREVDLSRQDLRGRDLSGQNLPGAQFIGADLSGANLRGAMLTGAWLSGADLSGADLTHADLRNADLQDARLVGTTLLGACLLGAKLRGADLSGSKLVGASVDPESLRAVRLDGAALPNAHLEPRLRIDAVRVGVRALAATKDGTITAVMDDRFVVITTTQRVTEPLLRLPTAVLMALSRDGLGLAIASGELVTNHRFFPLEGGEPVTLHHELAAPPVCIALAGRGSARVLFATAGNRSEIQELRMLENEPPVERPRRPSKLGAIKASLDPRSSRSFGKRHGLLTAAPEHGRSSELGDSDHRSNTEHHGTVGRAVALASSPDGRWIAAACSDQSLFVISPLSREVLAPPLVLEGHRKSITALAFGDGPRLASASSDGTVRLWDLLAGRELHGLALEWGFATTLAFGNEDLLAYGTRRGVVSVVRADTLSPIGQVQAHSREVTALVFVSQTLLATGSRDGTVKLWRLPSLALQATFISLPEGWVAFAPDGRYKAGGRVTGDFSHAAADCRFEVGELDEHVPGLRLSADERLFDPVADP